MTLWNADLDAETARRLADQERELDSEDEDVTFLFITNKAFGIHYVGDVNDPEAPVAAS